MRGPCAARLGGAGSADIWFGGGRRQAAFAAFANSAAASALDLDDGHRAAGGHPGAAVIPAVLAVAQEVQAGWSEVLAALVAGYEVGVRISAARDFSALDTLVDRALVRLRGGGGREPAAPSHA
ncbi:MAG: MmgE/PrpD family protein [Desulfomicrobium escambiense]|nr:MmgE/PrpD family protein [Desulfomicrobium escambiense]